MSDWPRNRLTTDVPLGPTTWLRVGGPAEMLFLPSAIGELSSFLRALPDETPLSVLGAASNVLIRDGGVDGVVVRLAGRAWGDMTLVDDTAIRAGAGTTDRRLASFAASHGVAGMEFLCAIPGTLGGAVAMNAGCYGREIADILVGIEALTRRGEALTLSKEELGLSYRASRLPEGVVVTHVTLRGTKGDAAEIGALMAELEERKRASQPTRARTGGSTFANPSGAGATAGVPRAWQLLESVGARDMQRGGARFSSKHCNFLINDGTASADDLEYLAEDARARVLEASGIALRWEIRRYGRRG